MGDTIALPYDELAARLGITPASARNRVRRRGWHRTRGNDGRARVHVPLDMLPPDGDTDAPLTVPTCAPTDERIASPSDGASLSTDAVRDELVARVRAEAELEAVRERETALVERLADAQGERDHWRNHASELTRLLDAMRAERDHPRGLLARLLGRAA